MWREEGAQMTGGSLLLAEGGRGGKHPCGPSSWTWGLQRGAPYSSPTHGTARSLPQERPLPLGLRRWGALWPPVAWPVDPASGPSPLSLPASALWRRGRGVSPHAGGRWPRLASLAGWSVKVCLLRGGGRWGPVA